MTRIIHIGTTPSLQERLDQVWQDVGEEMQNLPFHFSLPRYVAKPYLPKVQTQKTNNPYTYIIYVDPTRNEKEAFFGGIFVPKGVLETPAGFLEELQQCIKGLQPYKK